MVGKDKHQLRENPEGLKSPSSELQEQVPR